MNTTARNEDLVARVRAALSEAPDLREKKMFGSLGFMVRDSLCVTARPERLMCRISPALHAQALQREGVETVVMKGRPYPGYVFVAASAVKTKAALDYWIDLCLAHNATLPAPKQKKTPAARVAKDS
ncbi:MAG: TfoX/Sxy family protein [Roseateles sp.]|uniref:TfoX/Sxy family protein n=1 Tax=Roseateles sp. TaxID=1971397 RepID=UPI0040373D53